MMRRKRILYLEMAVAAVCITLAVIASVPRFRAAQVIQGIEIRRAELQHLADALMAHEMDSAEETRFPDAMKPSNHIYYSKLPVVLSWGMQKDWQERVASGIGDYNFSLMRLSELSRPDPGAAIPNGDPLAKSEIIGGFEQRGQWVLAAPIPKSEDRFTGLPPWGEGPQLGELLAADDTLNDPLQTSLHRLTRYAFHVSNGINSDGVILVWSNPISADVEPKSAPSSE